jgi:hypothetical protein
MKRLISTWFPWLNKSPGLFAGALFLFFPLSSYAQAPEIGFWSGLNAQKTIKRTFVLHVNTQARLGENLSVMQAYLGEIGLSYKINKHWQLSGYYRYTARRKQNQETGQYPYRPYHRIYGEACYDHKIWKLKFNYRLRYQDHFKDDEKGKDADKSYLRNKLELSYPNKTRFTPYISTDVFYRLGEIFEQMRNKAGVEVALHRRHQLDFYGFTDYQLAGRQENKFVLGVQYKVKF